MIRPKEGHPDDPVALARPRRTAPRRARLGRSAERGHEQTAFYDEYVSRMPTPEETRLLGLQPGTTILLHIRTGYTEQRPVRVSFNVFAGDRNQIVTTHGDVRIIGRFRPEEAPE
ncbi:UTRA domain-containing protein [Micromonospora sp. NPDC020750]|uniref:UTRA domain-containing protein n=1 Tax=unclassified Micromonospora TaxID=2617518 RepID=UPI00378CAE6B